MDIVFSEKSLVYIFVVCIAVVTCNVISPKDLEGTVNKSVTFMWNTTGTAILDAKWGLYDNSAKNTLPSFIRVSTLLPGDGIEFSTDLDNVASRYKNRVHFIGNISQGRAWFVITNLSLDDTKNYSANIKESGSAFQTFRVNLTVKEAPTTAPPPTPTSSTSIPKSSSNTTSTRPTDVPTTPTPPDPGVIIIIVIVVIIIVIFGVIVCCVYCCNDIWKKFIGCCGCRKKDCCCYHCCQRCRCGPPWCPAEP